MENFELERCAIEWWRRSIFSPTTLMHTRASWCRNGCRPKGAILWHKFHFDQQARVRIIRRLVVSRFYFPPTLLYFCRVPLVPLGFASPRQNFSNRWRLRHWQILRIDNSRYNNAAIRVIMYVGCECWKSIIYRGTGHNLYARVIPT